MAKFTKKPQVVDAVQWNGKNLKEIQKLIGADNASSDGAGGLIVKILRGSMFITKGNYVIKEPEYDEHSILSEFKFNLEYSPKKK